MWLNFRLNVRNFFKKNKKKIYIIIVVWFIVVAINKMLGNLKEKELPSVYYEPHTPIIEGKDTPKKIQTKVENIVEKYYNYCNNAEYEEAFNLISEECRNYKFGNDLNKFKKYIQYIFDGNKKYSIQSYSSKDNIYVYTVSIFPDIMATGMNEENDELCYEEKAVMIENEDGTINMAVDGYIGEERVNYVGEDNYMKIWIDKKIIKYDKEVYLVTIKNKTDNIIVLANRTETNEVILNMETESRSRLLGTFQIDDIYIGKNNTKTVEIPFQKYFEEKEVSKELVFNNIRILPKYTAVQGLWEQELANAIKLYSLTLTL